MKKLILFYLMVGMTIAATNAQDKSHEDKRERYRSEKIAFITDKLNLTPEEAQKFWPLYNQLEQKKWEVQKKRHDLETQVREAEENLSDKEVIRLTRDFTSNLQKESNLYAEYNEKFLEVLPPHKVLALYKAENEFRMYMIKKFRNKHQNDD